MPRDHTHEWEHYFSGFRCPICGKKRGWTPDDYREGEWVNE